MHVGSDIDVLVKFDVPATSSRYFGVQFTIADAIGGYLVLDNDTLWNIIREDVPGLNAELEKLTTV